MGTNYGGTVCDNWYSVWQGGECLAACLQASTVTRISQTRHITPFYHVILSYQLTPSYHFTPWCVMVNPVIPPYQLTPSYHSTHSWHNMSNTLLPCHPSYHTIPTEHLYHITHLGIPRQTPLHGIFSYHVTHSYHNGELEPFCSP